jgi:steroid Delta-isomerase
MSSGDDHPARKAATRSMAAAMAGDRDGWLALFAPEAIVEDPVGPSPLDPEGAGHRGHDAIGGFWDTSISAAEAIRFEVHDSFAAGSEVVNVVSIHLTLAGGATARTDAAILYRVDEQGRIASLRAFWEMDRMLETITQPDG